jgi:hypothetical protein
MTFTIEELITLVTTARELGASHMKIGDFEIHFDSKQCDRPESGKSYLDNRDFRPNPVMEQLKETVLPPVIKDEKFEDILKPVSPFDELSEEEILYWGTAHGDKLIADRIKREEELKNKLE